jgi:hypothetical protein
MFLDVERRLIGDTGGDGANHSGERLDTTSVDYMDAPEVAGPTGLEPAASRRKTAFQKFDDLKSPHFRST